MNYMYKWLLPKNWISLVQAEMVRCLVKCVNRFPVDVHALFVRKTNNILSKQKNLCPNVYYTAVRIMINDQLKIFYMLHTYLSDTMLI